MGKPMDRKTAGLLATFLWVTGAAGTLMNVIQLADNPGYAMWVGTCAGLLVVGTWMGTVLNLSKDEGEPLDEAAK